MDVTVDSNNGSQSEHGYGRGDGNDPTQVNQVYTMYRTMNSNYDQPPSAARSGTTEQVRTHPCLAHGHGQLPVDQTSQVALVVSGAAFDNHTRIRGIACGHSDTINSHIQVSSETPPTAQPGLPLVYVSAAGLLTVILNHEMAVEMTIDKTIRVINRGQKAAAATNGRGNASCIYHTAAKIFQENTSTDASIFWARKVKMVTENITFALGPHCHTMSLFGVDACEPSFADLEKDMSVNLLYSSSGYGPSLIPSFREVAEGAKHTFHKRGGVTIIINGMRIFQNSRGDVLVSCGPKFIRASALTGSLYLQTHFVEMSVESSWRVKIKRGEQQVLVTFQNFFVSDGYRESGFDPMGQLLYQPVKVVTQVLIDNTHLPASSSEPIPEGQAREDDEFENRCHREGCSPTSLNPPPLKYRDIAAAVNSHGDHFYLALSQ